MSELDPALCCRLLDTCIVAYGIQHGRLPTQSENYKAAEFATGTTPMIAKSEGIHLGLVTQTSDDWVVVTFRGTLTPHMAGFFSWVRDWLNDFRAGPTSWHVKGKQYGKVEIGFAEAVLDLWPGIMRILSGIDLSSKRGLLVAGHSKGGAMCFPAASLLRAMFPSVPIQVCAFAAPLACDAAFLSAYQGDGLDAATVRFQNRFDLVPFVPYWPHLERIGELEARAQGGVAASAVDSPVLLHDDYVTPGQLRYLGGSGTVLTGADGESQARHDIRHALEHMHFEKIKTAHGAGGRYYDCICRPAGSTGSTTAG